MSFSSRSTLVQGRTVLYNTVVLIPTIRSLDNSGECNPSSPGPNPANLEVNQERVLGKIELFVSEKEPERQTIWRYISQAMRTWVTQFLVEEEGQDVVEYSLLLVLMGTVILIFLSGIGVSVTSIFSKIGSKLEQVSAEIR